MAAKETRMVPANFYHGNLTKYWTWGGGGGGALLSILSRASAVKAF